ncbi:MAG: FAD-binding protein, partial [Caldilineaceae bacterium]|nr:FAD-binding protein [Caldilineaceae bacterium]
MVDLLVIGAGLSGLCAALTAAEAGLSVRVIAKGMGALHWGAGTVDLLGYLPGEVEPVVNPLDRLADLPPGHPLRALGPEQLCEAIGWFQDRVAAAGLGYSGRRRSATRRRRAPICSFPPRLARGDRHG